MSTAETKVRHTWAAQHTAGHNTHGQTAIYDETIGKDVAIVYDGDAHAELIVRAVNSYADMLEALRFADLKIRQLSSPGDLTWNDEGMAKITAAIQKARGGAA